MRRSEVKGRKKVKTEKTLMEKMGEDAVRILTSDKCEVKHRLYEQYLIVTNLPFVRHRNLTSDENELHVGAFQYRRCYVTFAEI